MAAVSNRDRLTYTGYVRQLGASHIASRMSAVYISAGLGAGVGATIGVCAGPGALATVPACAGVGAGVGAIVGIVASVTYDASDYRKYKKSLTDRARAELDQFIVQNGEFSQDNVCGITQEVPCDPVTIEGEPQVYERKFLMQYIKEKGESPMTRKKITPADVKQAHEHLAKVGNFCAEILNDPAKRAKLKPSLLKGIALLQKDNDKRAEKFIQKSHDDSLKRMQSGKLSLRNHVIEAEALENLFNGCFGELALRKRYKLNLSKIVLDRLDLKKNEKKIKAEVVEEKYSAA